MKSSSLGYDSDSTSTYWVLTQIFNNIQSLRQNYEVGDVILILQMKKLKLKKSKRAPYYLDCKYENQMHIFWLLFYMPYNSNRSMLIPEFCEAVEKSILIQ